MRTWISKGEQLASTLLPHQEGNALKEQLRRADIRRMAGIVRDDGARYQPRMHDLRHTFAVHRLTAWIKRGADLNRMVPALSAYMGKFASAQRTAICL